MNKSESKYFNTATKMDLALISLLKKKPFEYITVSDINKIIKYTIEQSYELRSVYLKGEISNIKYHGRGHLYFSLKDETSKINAVMFNYKNSGMSVMEMSHRSKAYDEIIKTAEADLPLRRDRS